MNRLRADLLLLLASVIWGTTFVAQKIANDHIGPIAFVAARFAIATAFLAPAAIWETRRHRRSGNALPRSDLLRGLGISLCLCTATCAQQIGLVTTTATHAGFLTAAYIAFVPFLAWAVARARPRPPVLLACAIALYGAWLLAGSGTGLTAAGWNRGDAIILGSDLVWALHVTLVGHWRGIAARPFLLSWMQCAAAAAATIPVAWIAQPASWDALRPILPEIAYAGILSSGVAFTLQIVSQRHTPAAEAALVMSLESVFAAAAGAVMLGDTLTRAASFGALLILVGAVLVEIGPLLRLRATR